MIPFLGSPDSSRDLAKVFAGEPAEFQFPGLSDARFGVISGFVHRLLGHFDLAYLSEMVLVLLKEIISNCSKANAKRLFCQQEQLSLVGGEQYDTAMRRFSGEVLRRWDDFVAENKAAPYYVKIVIQVTDAELIFTVRNNVEILPREWERIRSKFDSFQRYSNINTAFSEIRDESEGAGLGIFLILSLLANVQVSPENYRITSQNGETINEVRIPRRTSSDSFQTDFCRRTLAEIQELPSFPENITNLLNLCDSTTASVGNIAASIQRDPALTAQILKIANSAGYMSRMRNPGLEDAVKIIGLKVIRTLLMVTGARSVINRTYRVRDLEAIWEDSNRVSFYSRRLARMKGSSAIAEQATVAGLLFELGKIVLLSLQPEVVKTVQRMLGRRRVRNSSLLEETLLGISHPTIGASMAEHWNFPPPLVVALRFQQKPLLAPPEHADLVRAIYMGAGILHAAADQIDYWSLEPEVLEYFGVQNERQFAEMVKSFEVDYRNSSTPI